MQRRNHHILSTLLLILLATLGGSLRAQKDTEQLASYYYQGREYDKAIELYEQLYQRTQNKYYYQMLYECYSATEDYKSATKLVERRMKQHADELTLWVDLGLIQSRQGDKKKADKTFLSAIDKVGYNTKEIEALSNAFQKESLWDYSLATYQEARKKMRNEYAFMMEIAAIYERKGDYESMMQEYFTLLDHQPNMMGSIQLSLQRVLKETSNPKIANGLRKALTTRIQNDPNNRRYLDMMIWFSLQEKDFDFALTQAKAIDSRFPGQGEETILQIGQMAQNNDDYTIAAKCYSYLVARGTECPHYFQARLGELKVRFLQLNQNYQLPSADYLQLKTDYLKALSELGKGLNTIPLMADLAHLEAYYGNEVQEAADLLYDIIEIPKATPQVLAKTKLELGDLLLFSGNVWDASLLYSQVEKSYKNDVIGAQAKFKNAKLSYYNHDFTWAKSQLDVLRASTSKLIANDAMELSLLISDNMEEDSTFDMLELYATADLMLYRNQLDSAWDGFRAIQQRTLAHPLLDDVLMQQAKIRMRQGRYAEADTLLQQIVNLYAEDLLADDALIMLAEMSENQFSDPSAAKGYYEQLILDYPTSLFVDRARKRYNEIKKTVKD